MLKILIQKHEPLKHKETQLLNSTEYRHRSISDNDKLLELDWNKIQQNILKSIKEFKDTDWYWIKNEKRRQNAIREKSRFRSSS